MNESLLEAYQPKSVFVPAENGVTLNRHPMGDLQQDLEKSRIKSLPMDKSSAHGRTQPTFQSQDWRFCLFWTYRLGYTVF